VLVDQSGLLDLVATSSSMKEYEYSNVLLVFFKLEML